MDEQELKKIGLQLVSVFFSEKLVPLSYIKNTVSQFPGAGEKDIKLVAAIWKKKNEEAQKKGKGLDDINTPVYITRGTSMDAEEELTRFLPEEKIIINKEFFRKKLDGVQWADLKPADEKKLVEDLESESIGLSTKEVIFYYNLIKVSAMGEEFSAAPQPTAQQQQQRSATQPQASKKNYAALVLDLVELHICSFENLTLMNEGRRLDKDLLQQVQSERFNSGKIKPKIISILLGEVSPKFIDLFKGFLELVATKWGYDADEMYSLAALYMLLNQGSDKLMPNVKLSTSMSKFVHDELGRVKAIQYVSISFMYTFLYVLITQIYEIYRKFVSSNEQQKIKLVKLYNSEERMQMLIGNAVKIASQKIEGFRSESKETLKNFKAFASKRGSIITAVDIFKTNYDD